MNGTHSDLHTLALRGDDAGPFPLTWGQGNMWESIIALGERASRLNIAGVYPLYDPAPVGTTLERLGQRLPRFDIFRTTFDRTRTEQTFRSTCDVDVQVRDARDASDNADMLAAAGLSTEAFAMDEPPVRLGLLTRDGVVTHVAMTLSHLAFDGSAYGLLRKHVCDAVAGRSPAATGVQTTELLAYERSVAGVRRSDAVIGRWVREATRLPSGCGLLATTPGPYSAYSMRSRAIAVSAQILATRMSTSTASVVVAALAIVIRRHVERRLAAMLLVCSNRGQPRLVDFVGQAIANALLVLPDDEQHSDFSSFAKTIYVRSLEAFVRARYDCVKWREVLSDLSERGSATDLSFYVNDTRRGRDPWAGLECEVGDLRTGLVQRTEITKLGRRDMSDATFFANLNDVNQECVLNVVCDDRRIPPDDAVGLLSALEILLVDEAVAP